MSKEQLDKAKALIEQRKFDEAREILRWIPDSPTAVQWLEKLDEIAPEDVEPFPSIQNEKVDQKAKRPCWMHCMYMIGAAMLISAVFVGIVALITYDPDAECDDLSGQEKAMCIVDHKVNKVQTVEVTNSKVTVLYRLDQAIFSTSEYERAAHDDFANLICELRSAGFSGRDFDLTADVVFEDSFGEERYNVGVSALVSASSASRINCDNRTGVNIERIAEEYYIHPSIR